jgi:hypothetical protein
MSSSLSDIVAADILAIDEAWDALQPEPLDSLSISSSTSTSSSSCSSSPAPPDLHDLSNSGDSEVHIDQLKTYDTLVLLEAAIRRFAKERGWEVTHRACSTEVVNPGDRSF